jgi:pyrroline-5-carboxylate reductase
MLALWALYNVIFPHRWRDTAGVLMGLRFLVERLLQKTMANDLTGKRVAFLGAGKMGGIILQALLKNGLLRATSTCATVAHEERAKVLAKKFKVKVGTNNIEAAKNADVIVIAVKPQVVEDVVREISPYVTPKQMVVSVAASVPTAMVEKHLAPGVPVLRAMPNTPCLMSAGMTAICKGRNAHPEDVALTTRLFEVVGRTVVVDEKHMDAVTALSASGPAYIYIILESLAEAGVKVGLPRDIATLLAAQTALGAAKVVLETGDHPALLKDAVTTPAGCTIDAIMELEEGKLRVTLIKAVVKAAQRAKELAFG